MLFSGGSSILLRLESGAQTTLPTLMGTRLWGQKGSDLRQALVIAGVLEFAGAVLLVVRCLKRWRPLILSVNNPVGVAGMVSVLLACGLWLQVLAAAQKWPVSSSCGCGRDHRI